MEIPTYMCIYIYIISPRISVLNSSCWLVNSQFQVYLDEITLRLRQDEGQASSKAARDESL
jgi:hypothetical protein